ncbi:uncharacterized protein LOC117282969 isoform X2 [Cryptotermes secundus]|uniref:uncharacterized protein LOC117282969 isoform X2 n=1 Tax=Cryptotermes secundus TaxID=105785 RepID=UPI001454B9CA|nr:uncharacterized protein LOC117282969 isoform X2 [Cryptotermes secundus]
MNFGTLVSSDVFLKVHILCGIAVCSTGLAAYPRNVSHAEVLAAATLVFCRQNRTLYRCIFPNISERQLDSLLLAAWDSSPETEKNIYISEVSTSISPFAWYTIIAALFVLVTCALRKLYIRTYHSTIHEEQVVVNRALKKNKELTTRSTTPKLQGCPATCIPVKTQTVPTIHEEKVVVYRPLEKNKELTTHSTTPKLQGCPAPCIPVKTQTVPTIHEEQEVVDRPREKQKELTTSSMTPKLQGCPATCIPVKTQTVPTIHEEQEVVNRALEKNKELTTSSTTPKLQGCPATRISVETQTLQSMRNRRWSIEPWRSTRN